MTDPKSLLLHIDSSSRTLARVRLARLLAERFDAQVTAMFCTRPLMLGMPVGLEGGAAAVAMVLAMDEKARAAALAAFTQARAGDPRLEWKDAKVEPLVSFTRQAMYSDLLILGQREADDPNAGELAADFVPGLLADTGRPALLLPYAGEIGSIGRCVLVAWNESRESARALSAALPWLRDAARVHVVCHSDDGDLALSRVADYLQLHRIEASLHRAGPDRGQVGNALLSQAADLEADLLVMGCYGSSRVREWLLGGVTREILRSMTLPVLMVH